MKPPTTFLSFVWAFPKVAESDALQFIEPGLTTGDLLQLSAQAEWSIVEGFLSKAIGTTSTATSRYKLSGTLQAQLAGQTFDILLHLAWHQPYESVTAIASLEVPGPLTPERADLVIALSQSFSGRNSDGQMLTGWADEDIHSLRDAVAKRLGEIGRSSDRWFAAGPAMSLCVERRAWDGSTVVERGDVAETVCPKSIDYGLATADEGWRHVGEATAVERLGAAWGTRTFVEVRCAGSGVIVHNRKGASYVAGQSQYLKEFFGTVDPYFGLDSRIGGLDHGILSALERVTIRRARAELWLDTVRRNVDAGPFKLVRSGLDDVSELLNSFLISEVDALERLLGERMGLSALVSQLDRVASAIDEQTRFDYENKVNRRIAILTWATVGLTVVTIAVALLPYMFPLPS